MAKKRAAKEPRASARQSKRGRQRARSHRTTVLLRWCFVGVGVFVGFLYYRPLTTYFETRAAVSQRAAEVRELEAENARLAERLERSSTLEALSREARRSSLVRPGERLFIVKGIEEWRRAQSTMPRDG